MRVQALPFGCGRGLKIWLSGISLQLAVKGQRSAGNKGSQLVFATDGPATTVY